MLAIGRILRTGARLLLLDEPTEGLAPVIIQQIGRTIRTLKQQGFTILLVEQNFRFASTVADRYYVMEHGRVVDRFANAELDANARKAARVSRSLTQQGPTTASEQGGMSMKRLLGLAALAAVLACGTRAGAADQRQDRRAERHVEPLCRPRRPGLGRGRQDGDRRLHQGPSEREGRARQRRPPEQAGRRLATSPANGTTSTRST